MPESVGTLVAIAAADVNFDGTFDLVALRSDGARLVATVTSLEPGDRDGRVPAVGAYYDRYRAQLVAHHTHEDLVFYPALSAKVGDDRMCREQLRSSPVRRWKRSRP